jgi:DNA-binding PadR family transcriptional regulator
MSLKWCRKGGKPSYIPSMLLAAIQGLILHLEVFVSVRHALLALLSAGPKYGLQLREEFEANTGQVWPLNVGQVYTTLQRLERDGLVTAIDSESGGEPGPQKAFRITEAGSVELDQWLRVPPDLSTPPRDDLVMKVLIAVRVPGTDVSEIIQAHRRYLVQLMQEWTRLKEDDNGRDVAFSLVVDSELFRIDSVVRWLDAAEGRLRRARADGWNPAQAAAAASAGLPTRPKMGVRR